MAVPVGSLKEAQVAGGVSTELITIRTTVAIAFGGAAVALVAAPAAGSAIMLRWADWVPLSTVKALFRIGFSTTNCIAGSAGTNASNTLNNYKGNLNIMGGDAEALKIYNVDPAGALDVEAIVQYAIVVL